MGTRKKCKFNTRIKHKVLRLFLCLERHLCRKSTKRIHSFVMKICSGIVVTAILAAVVIAAIHLYDIINLQIIRPLTCDEYWDSKHISNDIVYKYRYSSNRGKICNTATGKTLHRGLEWVVYSDDTLAVFAKNGKRGYLNRFTGEIRIPATFTRAWVFCDGLAAVEKDNTLVFINSVGEVVINTGLKVYHENPHYGFKNGYCIIRHPDNGDFGLIDKKGKWVLPPEFDNIFCDEGFWNVERNGLTGLFDANMKEVFPIAHTQIIVENGQIEVGFSDHTTKIYDLAGNIIVDFHIDEIYTLTFESKVNNSDEYSSDSIYEFANCRSYLVRGYYNEYYGLLNSRGERVTPPIYTSITAISKNLYLCQPHGVIVNDSGEIIE